MTFLSIIPRPSSVEGAPNAQDSGSWNIALIMKHRLPYLLIPLTLLVAAPTFAAPRGH